MIGENNINTYNIRDTQKYEKKKWIYFSPNARYAYHIYIHLLLII